MTRIFAVLVPLIYLHGLTAEETRQLDLEPNDAQNLIEQQDQTLKYAPKIESNVPAVRFLGKEPHDVLEDIYLAKQYHGQDGLGGYLYGYQVPDIAKNEKKEPAGSLRGAYNYVNGDGQEIRVQYWDDGTGFHQEDNVAEILPQPVEDSPEVKAAKEAFFKRWQEEAERNSHPIEDPQAAATSQTAAATSQTAAATSRTATAAQPNLHTAASSQESRSVAQPTPEEGAYVPDDEGRYIPGEDEGPPKGFFYAFDYPVGIIVKDQGRALPTVAKRAVTDNLRTIYEENKRRFEKQLNSQSYLIN
ncbi:hypothetical protein ABEB36_011890 [Hypothenemus hampei]|uniref:Uncharacterized protein n=1 Tax=Hypothenemus hampei TaxID=57062 RepID=A0ABD1E9M4_HYPHA